MKDTRLPRHVELNRDYWTSMSQDWVEPGKRSWNSSEITWGIWATQEHQISALGDLSLLDGLDVIELGCGTAYFSAWLARLGAKPVGIDITAAQLETARALQTENEIYFPLIEGSAEDVPLPDGSFDLAISEYGASIWCDPYRWVPEAGRLLRPGGRLVFLRNSTIVTLCTGGVGPATLELSRPYFGLHQLEWDEDPGVEFHLPTGPMLRCLRENGFELENFIEIEPPADAKEVRFEYVSLDWARQWPSEEIWCCRKR